jgi:hypothetical protein
MFLASAVTTWHLAFRFGPPAFEQLIGFSHFGERHRDLATIVGHWFAWQLPAVVPCVLLWLLGQHLGLMPSLSASLGSGGSWRRVVRAGLAAGSVLAIVTLVLGPAVGGRLGFHPYLPKVAGDLVSNMYEEIVHRGFLFAAIYGLVAGATFPLEGKLDRRAVAVATVGSTFAFAALHAQYPLALRVLLGVVSLAFVWPWVRARSLWAPWVVHMIGDVVGDTFLVL